MPLALTNTLTNQKEHFATLDPARVTMYVCGPTVYNYAHIGNARPAVVFDVLYRLLKRSYPQVVYARNVTDVDDKINQAALDSGVAIDVISSRFLAAYHADMAALGNLEPVVEPRATEHIAAMLAMCERLIASGHAYVAEGHVLFAVERYSEYGQLSNRDWDDMIAGARVEVAPYKRHPADFVLWKPSEPHLPGWDSAYGRGRPGWHIECSAMAAVHLGQTIDIHGGGVDLVFPHHENEIAQSRCAHGGAPFARYWLHNGFVTVEKKKMSKSLGNVVLIRDLRERVHPEVMRYWLLSAHYRQPLDYSDSAIAQLSRALDRLYAAVGPEPVAELPPSDGLIEALEDDLNTPRALAELHRLAALCEQTDRDGAAEAKARLYAGAQLLGLLGHDRRQWFDVELEDADRLAIEAEISARAQAKRDRDFKRADAIRDALRARGVVLEDGPAGTSYRVDRQR